MELIIILVIIIGVAVFLIVRGGSRRRSEQRLSEGGQLQPPEIATQEHPKTTTVLVLGILGFFIPILGPFAWSAGNNALRECTQGWYIANDQLKLGRVFGIVCTILLIVEIVVTAILLIIIFVLQS